MTRVIDYRERLLEIEQELQTFEFTLQEFMKENELTREEAFQEIDDKTLYYYASLAWQHTKLQEWAKTDEKRMAKHGKGGLKSANSSDWTNEKR